MFDFSLTVKFGKGVKVSSMRIENSYTNFSEHSSCIRMSSRSSKFGGGKRRKGIKKWNGIALIQ